VVILADERIYQSDIMAALRFSFPFGHPWMVPILGYNRWYLVEATPSWCAEALVKRKLMIGDIPFSVIPWDEGFDAG
jgi:hypothetical protein